MQGKRYSASVSTKGKDQLPAISAVSGKKGESSGGGWLLWHGQILSG